jgi:ElaB/YqjD/DUF883 family membrane-anchored ribosome-binding protein
MSNDLREELENALQGTDLAPSSETAPSNESTVTPSSGDSGTPTADPVAVSTPNDAPAVDLNAMAEKPRDEAGRFAPKPAEGIQPGPKGNQPPAAAPESGLPTPEQSRPIDRPPQAWPVAEREHWAALPDAVKNRVMTRERQIQQVIQETTEARRFTEEVTKTITPYMAMIQSEGGTPVTAIASLFQTAGALRTAPPQQKAQLVAAMVKQFGIDINMLDSALAGQGPAADPIEERINQRVSQAIAPMQQRYQQMEMQQQQEMMQQRQVAVSTVEQFIASQPYGDVLRADMADMMDYATKRGMSMTLEQCYQRACEMHPQISQIMANERQKQNLQQSSQAAQAAKGRAISVSGAPSGGGMQQVQEGDDIRSAIEASLAQMTR